MKKIHEIIIHTNTRPHLIVKSYLTYIQILTLNILQLIELKEKLQIYWI